MMRVNVFVDHINPHERIAERQLKTQANKYCKQRWGKPADECWYNGMSWDTWSHAEFAQHRTGLCCSVFQPGEESVVLVLNERKRKD